MRDGLVHSQVRYKGGFFLIKRLKIRQFSGGIGTTGEKKDVANSAQFTKHLNPFEDPSYITLSRETTKVSGTTVTDLVYWMDDASPYSTDKYFLGSGGKVYKETSAGTWSNTFTVASCGGEGLKIFDDYLYEAGATTLNRYGKLSGTPAEGADFLSDGTTNIDQSATGTGATDYTPPVAIDETATHRNTITPTRDPVRDIVINVDVVGSGNWTLTLHDSNNILIGAKTTANGDMVVGDNTFTFATPLRVVIDNAYHYHVTSTVADGGVDTGTNTDLEASYFVEHFGILIDTDFHMMDEFLNFLVILNNRYIAKWDLSSYNPNLITLAPGFEARCMAKFNEFLVIGAFKGPSIQNAEEARLYFWDGIETTFNYFTDCRIGAPNCLVNSEGSLIGVYGNDGSMYLGTEPFEEIVNKIPKLTRGNYVYSAPGAITTFEGNALIGIGLGTDDGTNLEQGVYEYGSQQEQLPHAFNFPFTVSTATTKSATLKIGMVKSVGSDLYIGWRDNTTYGVDKVALGDDANACASWESLIFDNGDPNKQFLPMNLIITFEALSAGQSVTPKYKLNRAATFTDGTAASTVGDTRVEWPIYTRCKEMEFGFDLASTSNTFIKVTGITLVYDNLSKEGLE